MLAVQHPSYVAALPAAGGEEGAAFWPARAWLVVDDVAGARFGRDAKLIETLGNQVVGQTMPSPLDHLLEPVLFSEVGHEAADADSFGGDSARFDSVETVGDSADQFAFAGFVVEHGLDAFADAVQFHLGSVSQHGDDHAAQGMAGVEMVSTQVDDMNPNSEFFTQSVNRVLHIHRAAAKPVDLWNDEMLVTAFAQQVQQGRAFGAVGEWNGAAGVVLHEDRGGVRLKTVDAGPVEHVGLLSGNGLFLKARGRSPIKSGQAGVGDVHGVCPIHSGSGVELSIWTPMWCRTKC